MWDVYWERGHALPHLGFLYWKELLYLFFVGHFFSPVLKGILCNQVRAIGSYWFQIIIWPASIKYGKLSRRNAKNKHEQTLLDCKKWSVLRVACVVVRECQELGKINQKPFFFKLRFETWIGFAEYWVIFLVWLCCLFGPFVLDYNKFCYQWDQLMAEVTTSVTKNRIYLIGSWLQLKMIVIIS